MVSLDLILVDYFESDFKDNHYCIYKFFNVQNGQFYNGNNLGIKYNDSLKGKSYSCALEYKRNKLVVVSAE